MCATRARCKDFLLRTDNVVPEHTADLVAAAHLSNESLEDRSGASIHAEEKLDTGCRILKDTVFHILLARFPDRTRVTLMHSTQCFRFFLLCGFAEACLSLPGVSSPLVWSSFHWRRVFRDFSNTSRARVNTMWTVFMMSSFLGQNNWRREVNLTLYFSLKPTVKHTQEMISLVNSLPPGN